VKKISRICWNDKYWRAPSGREGKSVNSSSYEYQHGFGHEEWLFDTEKLIDGYHYAYLQSVAGTDRTGDAIDINLYTIKNEKKKNTRYWLGEILDVELVSPKESRRILKQYKEKGWYDEMQSQLNEVDVDGDILGSIDKGDFFTIKFKPQNLRLCEPYIFDHHDEAVKSNYYNLINFVQLPLQTPRAATFDFKAGHRSKPERGERSGGGYRTEISYIHNAIQDALYTALCQQVGEDRVSTEQNTGYGTRIDLVVQENENTYSFYEIKTHAHVSYCIREAIGQLLEYAYRHDNAVNISKMVVVGITPATAEDNAYIARLRALHQLPLEYMHFDIDSEAVFVAE